MSEIRQTATIEKIEVPPREPMISLADVLTSVGWVAFQGTKLVVKGAVAGTALAYRGGTALANLVQESRRQGSLSGVNRVTSSAASARDALAALAATSSLEVPVAESRALVSRLEELVAKNDKAGIAAVGRELVVSRQNRLQAHITPLVVEACRSIGFLPRCLNTDQGIVSACRKGTRQSLNIEVAKDKDGGVRIHFDADGFEGGVCVETLDALQAELHKRGVRYELHERRRKTSRPIRVGGPAQIRCLR